MGKIPTEFEKGSEWRQWDLHFHTPSSFDYQDRSVTNQDIIDTLSASGISAVVITDHHLIDVARIKDLQTLGKLKGIVVFPGIEFLSDARGSDPVHFIGIFSPDSDIDYIWGQIENRTSICDIKGKSKKVDQVYCDLITTTNLIHELGGIVTIHAGSKSNSIECITNSLSHAMAQKSDIASQVDVYEIGKEEDQGGYDSAVFPAIKKRLPMVICSDNHNVKKFALKQKCWIKADLTFEGLKQIIYEPLDRVFIGDTPPILSRIAENKTKYIEDLKIGQEASYKEGNGIWFRDIDIPLNKELVAIIGNKGSGKSAVADIIGLTGNTHNDKHFSFLKKKKFLNKGYAENYHAELTWSDNTSTGEVKLDTPTEHSKGERVRYLPQSYFEHLTNELEDSGFNKTLKSVTFSHLPKKQRLGKETFDELEEEKNKHIMSELVILRSELKDISADLIKLEDRLNPAYKSRVQSDIEEKKRELTQHLTDKPPVETDPSKDKSSAQAVETEKNRETLLQLNQELEKINLSISKYETEVANLMIEKQDLQHIFDELEQIKSNVKAYVEQNKERFSRYGLVISEIVSVELKSESIKGKIKERGTAIEEKEKLLLTSTEVDADGTVKDEDKAKVKECSLVVQKSEVLGKIENLKKLLSEPEKKYQEYQEKLRRWEQRKKEIEGSPKEHGSLLFLEEELKYLSGDLLAEIKRKIAERTEKAKTIYSKKKEIVDLYNVLKKSVDDRIVSEGDFSSKFKMEVEAGFRLSSDFADRFLGYINKIKTGTYCRAETKAVDGLFVDKNLLSVDDVMKLLNEAIDSLWEDKRPEVKDSERSKFIGDQVNDLTKFYDFLFSLEYLEPVYELKLDGKTLDELSPGEKGALLLVFYLMVDNEEIPLVIDQPEDNLDNKSVFEVLTHFIKHAKKHRQIIIVTHNPNLAVGADAEQIIYVDIDKKNNYKFTYLSGSIENQKVNQRIVEILEGTMPAFDKRKLKYQPEPIV